MEFGKVAKIYDKVIGAMEYEAWSNDIKFLIEKYAIQNPIILDASCGTGNHLEFLEKDYSCVGSDVSKSMIEEGRKKVNSELFVKDIQKLDFKEKFDVILSLYDSLNNLKDLKEAFRSVYEQLNSKGIFIFDVLTLLSMKDMNNYQIQAGHIDDCSYIWENFYSNEIWNWTFTTFVPTENGKYEKYVEEHEEYFHSIEDIKELLVKNGFEVLDFHDTYTMEKVNDKTHRINIVAKKP